ncbi:hypothetical protein T07_1067 [Trichinella nelsoni]|uniref:Uncharacterized protein n=1 Tax=Trichinella nelsoni TaxID=6336 RepID=A0A0V0RWD4_9BILA|nr:hypothetical protein T07_1067 [Trichinella nelsoni]
MEFSNRILQLFCSIEDVNFPSRSSKVHIPSLIVTVWFALIKRAFSNLSCFLKSMELSDIPSLLHSESKST